MYVYTYICIQYVISYWQAGQGRATATIQAIYEKGRCVIYICIYMVYYTHTHVCVCVCMYIYMSATIQSIYAKGRLCVSTMIAVL
jgi:hypothetical protein